MKEMKEIIKHIEEAIKDIEKWAGDAYITPDSKNKECPDGDEIYQALQVIKNEINKIKIITGNNKISNKLVDIFTANQKDNKTIVDVLRKGGNDKLADKVESEIKIHKKCKEEISSLINIIGKLEEKINAAVISLKRISDEADKRNVWLFKLEQVIADLEGSN